MQCIGITKKFKRCKNPSKYGLCHTHRWQPIAICVAILTLLGTLGGVFQDIVKPLLPSYKAKPPTISVTTLDGFTITDFTGNPVTTEHQRYCKEHDLIISNHDSIPIYEIDLIVRLPEPIVYNFEPTAPPGTSISWEPFIGLQTIVSGNVTRHSGDNPYPVYPKFEYHLQINSISPNKTVFIKFVTSNNPILTPIYALHDRTADGLPLGPSASWRKKVKGILPSERPTMSLSEHMNFIKGTYQYQSTSHTEINTIIALIKYDQSRKMHISRMHESSEKLKLFEPVSSF